METKISHTLSDGKSVTITHLPAFLEDNNHRFHVEVSSKSFTGYSFYQTVDSGKGMCYESALGRPYPFLYPVHSGFRSLYKKNPEQALKIFSQDLINILENDIASHSNNH